MMTASYLRSLSKRFPLSFLLFILLLTPSNMTTITHSYAAESAEGDPVPPIGGGGGGGGGGIFFYDYYLPLVFNPTDTRPGSTILITSALPGYVVLSFLYLNASVYFLYPHEMLTIPIIDTLNLRNGSLIRTTQPMQITVTESSNDEVNDRSTGYTVLPKRMHGFEYFNPYPNMKAAIYTFYSDTTVTILDTHNNTLNYMKIPSRNTTILSLKQNTRILTSNPSIVVLYRQDPTRGSIAVLAAPHYLWGETYKLSTVTPGTNQTIQTTKLSITATNNTAVQITRANGTTSTISLQAFETKTIIEQACDLIQEIREIKALQINVSLLVSLEYLWLQGQSLHAAAMQAWSMEKMFAAELYSLPVTPYSLDFKYLPKDPDSTVAFLSYDPVTQAFQLDRKILLALNQTTDLLYTTTTNTSQAFISSTNGYALGYSPGSLGLHANPSYAFPLAPNNPATYHESTTNATKTWYRLPDLNIVQVKSTPASPKEFNAVKYTIIINKNGSIPSSRFIMQIYLNNQLKYNTTITRLNVNETRRFELSEFYYLGERDINVTVSLDVINQITEFNENNNRVTLLIHISLNMQLRVSTALFVAGVLIYVLYKQGKKLWEKRSLRKGDVDAVLTIDELT